VTLGRVALLGEADAVLLGPGKPLTLLAYLRAIPGQTATREHLVDLFWADALMGVRASGDERWKPRAPLAMAA